MNMSAAGIWAVDSSLALDERSAPSGVAHCDGAQSFVGCARRARLRPVIVSPAMTGLFFEGG